MSHLSEEQIHKLTDLRHRLHTIAELSGEEKKTAKAIESFLKSTNPDELLTGIGGHGLIAQYKGLDEGPSVLIRCELDALPIHDEGNFEYRSQHKGVGHKCGHDGHMAIICGLAKMLSEKRPEKGEVLLLFQPAEETGAGAEKVLNDHKFKSLKPDYVFALHNLPGFKQNQVIIRDGAFALASVGMVVRLKGSTSHAAHPEQGRSPALAMAQLVESLSALPQFHTDLGQAAKATVIHVRLGERAFGTSPGTAEVMATLRAWDDDILEQIKQKAEGISRGLAKTYGLEVLIEWTEAFPVTANDGDAAKIIREAAQNMGEELIVKNEPFGWSEDFGHFTQIFKGAFFGLGAGKDHPALHAPDYDFADELIPNGVALFMGIIDQVSRE